MPKSHENRDAIPKSHGNHKEITQKIKLQSYQNGTGITTIYHRNLRKRIAATQDKKVGGLIRTYDLYLPGGGCRGGRGRIFHRGGGGGGLHDVGPIAGYSPLY